MLKDKATSLDKEIGLQDLFGCNCFSDDKMKNYLDDSAMAELKKVRKGDSSLSTELAAEVAQAMRLWAIERGATHFTHWFQPLNGQTAEKHNSFYQPEKVGKAILSFSSKELTLGEGDASSFPSGGLRATFEARGYTVWDTSSPAFIKDKVLFIPTAFISHTGETLDKKVPLLRSVMALEKQCIRILRVLGDNRTKHIHVNVGPEQEYFLIDKDLYDKRPDLKLTGRTLLGCDPPKSQELNDHYYGPISQRVQAFMQDSNQELWKVGISSKTEHKEVAPRQFEIAVVYGQVNNVVDSNQLLMDILHSTAIKHGFVALLHEKPFANMNGSGKHNNWSIETDEGISLLSPNYDPAQNLQFLLFLSAIVSAVDRYAPLFRASCATYSNDCRLGGLEAPPSVISVYLGEVVNEALENLTSLKPMQKSSITSTLKKLANLSTEITDRNRTSPFAFTGNKFEFRMVGSAQSIADANIIINTTVAQELSDIADRLESASDVKSEMQCLIHENYEKHKKVIFNGNGYDKAWEMEASRRNLPKLPTCIEAIPAYISPESIKVFETQKVLTETELRSRYEIALDTYAKQARIEASTINTMVARYILPAVEKNLISLRNLQVLNSKLSLSIDSLNAKAILISDAYSQAYEKNSELASYLDTSISDRPLLEQARWLKEHALMKMEELRSCVDKLEKLCDKETWPFPDYYDMLFED
ncbi:MAG: glutamine synthetase III [Sphaerochaetaceae bacterium]|nr:glutamine synthetase III [Sphaerochaetaceae bacterium]